MWEELARVSLRCRDHPEATNERCEICRRLELSQRQFVQMRLKREALLRDLKELLASKKIIIADVR